ncbi:hypothetical protein LCGC14_2407580 [marine sediment metagenome]|uniref:Uncharacterized protein n=1 Tax=marine sediment metagenome TaxID=412755 RepID=A0A0F9CFL3_9ZZZZ
MNIYWGMSRHDVEEAYKAGKKIASKLSKENYDTYTDYETKMD